MRDNCYDIFKYLNPKENDKISLLGKHNIEEFVYYLNKYYLEYRTKLNLSKIVTIGTEIESENLIYSVSGMNKIFKDNLLNDWTVSFDTSLDKGCEVKSPRFFDDFDAWINLSKACYILNEYSKIGDNCAAHVHIGSQILGEDRNNLLNFILL